MSCRFLSRSLTSFSSSSSVSSSGLRLQNRVCLVTGGGSGIGRETCRRFAQEGAKVAVADIRLEEAESTAEEIAKQFGQDKVIALQTDVSMASQVESMIQKTEQHFSGLHVLFNNAGIMHSQDDDAVNTPEDVWNLTMDVNAKGVWLGCRFGIPALQRSGGGAIINTASFVALMGAATPQIAYTASKGAVLSMTRELAVLHARQGIRVNALCPGPLRTELLMAFLDTEDKKQRRLVHVPLGRFGEPSEIANCVVFLASEESSFVTGSTFVVDGGITAAYVTPE